MVNTKTNKRYNYLIGDKPIKKIKLYTVWLVDGLEVNNYYLTWPEALALKKSWKSKGYDTKIQLVLDEANNIDIRG